MSDDPDRGYLKGNAAELSGVGRSVTRALGTGGSGQGSSDLAEHLHENGSEVYGLLNGRATCDESRFRATLPSVTMLIQETISRNVPLVRALNCGRFTKRGS